MKQRGTKISDILVSYDSLIENNKKQIKLLEEAAQRLYKEWFVDLRFPGYENTPIVDGVPEGWEKHTLSEISCRLESGSRPKGGIDTSIMDGVPSIGAENVIGLGKYNFASEKFVKKDFFSKMKRGKLKDRDILIYKDGAYIGRTSLFQDGFPYKEASVNEHVFLLHSDDESLQYYLFFTLYQHEYYLKMQKLNKNAAQPGINSKAMLSLPITLPSKNNVNDFNTFVNPIMKSIFALSKQNRNLELARNCFLPKLMNGEIEV
jgi:type I restriction enzyme S subunit